MLEEVRIRGLGVIDDAVLEIGPGLTVLTGETGAGKTMVVTALGLLLGSRADAGTVRAGAAGASVEGRFLVPGDGAVAARARDAGATLDEAGDGLRELLVARTVTATGRSRAHVGGRGAPVGLLAELADDLVAVHGQTDQVLLRSPARQRDVLDATAGDAVGGPLAAYRQAYARWRRLSEELDELTTRARERAREADLLRHGLDEVAAVDPRPGEDVELRAESARLTHAEDLREAAAEAHAALLGDPAAVEPAPDAATLVGAARRRLDAVAEHDADLAALATRLAEVGYLVADVGAELSAHLASLEADPARLAVVEERRAALTALTRRHGGDVAAVLAWAQASASRLAELDGDDDRRAGLGEEVAAARAAVDEMAARLTQARRDAAARLCEQATAELAGLAMPDARVHARVGDRGEPGPHGRDEVALLLAPHAGAEPRPLGRGASGGELSRVMLALEVVLAGRDAVPTFVFDEVDAGVGGRAAVEVGRRLARLAATTQVVVVTHLPQVAAFADRHLAVTKSARGHVTTSDVRLLDDDARVVELARMLAGQDGSGAARAHAAELLDLAAAERDAVPARQRTGGPPSVGR